MTDIRVNRPEPESAERSSSRLDSLTSLRFAAAAFVLLGHVQTGPYPSILTAHLFAFPRMAVTFFFVLSGFVLTWSHRRDYPAKAFWIRRFARIWPLYALVIVLLFPIGWAFVRHPSWDMADYVVVWLAVLLLLQSWCPMPRVHLGVNAVAWSLSCEAFYYAIFPFLRRRTREERSRRLTVVALALVAASFAMWVYVDDAAFLYFATGGRVEPVRYLPALVHLPDFLLGMVLALQVRSGAFRGVSVRTACQLLVAAMAGLYLLHWAQPSWFPMSQDAFAQIVALPLAYLLVGTFAKAEMAGGVGALRKPWLIRLGDWSYALYLIHVPVMWTLDGMLGQPSLGTAAVLAGPVLLLLNIGLSGLLHHTWERPWRRRIHRWLLPKVQAPPPQAKVA